MIRDVMIDLETLGQVPGCAILSIGAVGFNAYGVEVHQFDETVLRSSCAAVGLHEDNGTLAWWARQSSAALAVLIDAENSDKALPIDVALVRLSRFLKRFGPDVRVWGNGADFDNAILAAAYRAVGLKPYWRFWNGRCYRTLKSLHPNTKIERSGTHHRAIDDAIDQARHAVRMLWPLGSAA